MPSHTAEAPKAKAFQASEGMETSRIQVEVKLRAPLKPVERYAAVLVKTHALIFKTKPLYHIRRTSIRAGADSARSIYHTMPRHRGFILKRAQRIAHKPRMTGQTGQTGDLAIRCHAPSGYSRDNGVNCAVFVRYGHKSLEASQIQNKIQVV